MQRDDLSVLEYPPAPWRSRGGAWCGVFQADAPLDLPSGLQPLGGSAAAQRRRIVALIRYLHGTLRYDELIIGAIVRRGPYVGLYVDQIWVDDLASVWGGRRIWGLPKQLATFRWSSSSVQVADSSGPILSLTLDLRTALLPRLPLIVPAFGLRDGRLVYTLGRVYARLGRAGMRLHDWSERFGYHVGSTPLLALAAKPMQTVISAPTVLDDA